MKIYIEYNITGDPHGGGNQFLRSLKGELERKQLYVDSPLKADIILFNSHQNCDKILQLKSVFANKKFVHRVDGPIRLYNNETDTRDDVVYNLNNSVADATIFQGAWSKENNIRMGMTPKIPTAIIQNSVDKSIFYPPSSPANNKKVRLISASFSPNYKKGHKFYQYLDENLDFNKYEYVFAGQSPVNYKNISLLGCLNSHDLAQNLRESDLYITASENDPCSNSLLEAIAVGIGVLALNSGGHPELVKTKDHLFDDEFELLTKILSMEEFNNNIERTTIEEVANKYVSFFESIIAQ